ncbi:DNA repair protein RAD50, partial [Daphnia magna]
MSRIDQLSIQGIRNFSSENAEVIRFEPPVTLILGKNGSGKTTIIESLKYATTGEMPAGTNRGQSFIHDPKLSTKKMSIGCVKLQFFDEHNNKFIVTRSMEARILKSKLDFKTIDGTISKVQSDGTLKSHKNKNNDLNTFVCNTLGVSKALLNNVLFC